MPSSPETDFDDYSTSESIISTKKDVNEDLSSEEIGSKETKVVSLLRIGVIGVLVVAASLVCMGVYYYTSNKEVDNFETHFMGHSIKVIEVFQQNVEEKLQAMDAFSFSLTSYALERNLTWPFVTLPNYEGRARKIVTQADALSLLVIPFIEEDVRPRWENYTVENSGWVADSKAYQSTIDNNVKTGSNERRLEMPDYSSGIAGQIWRVNETTGIPVIDRTPGPWYPLWQNGPLLGDAPFENYNTLQNGWAAIYDLIRTGECTLGMSTDVGDPEDPSDTLREATRTLIRYWYGEDIKLYKGEGVGDIFYPIFRDFDDGSPVFTFEILGRDSSFVGQGDFHDDRYDYLVQSATVTDYIANGGAGRYSGVRIGQDLCQYNIRVYPTKDMEDEYVTSTPLILTVGAAIIFVFTSCIFFAYDRYVERRQRLVMRRALQSGAIVSSLFPAAIRERLMKETSNETEDKDGKWRYMSPKRRVKSYLDGSEMDAKPIADLFPNTTILFADIVSFTAWSSSREPAQVFELLQSIYQGFDNIARKHTVFKVETIGDCYVAVAGVPEPQDDHVVRMAKFTRECVRAFCRMTRQLERKLGPDTGDLQMRFGLHSGPCTAGVLRGERSRFQLFGDTINMASRMESMGAPNKIQVSKQTANLLQEAGKGDWISPREDEILVKGKGKVSTFWLSVPGLDESGSIYDSVNKSRQSFRVFGKDSKEQRLVDWNTDVLLGHLRKVVAHRNVVKGKKIIRKDMKITREDREGKTCLDEASNVISMPAFDPNIASKEADPSSIDLSDAVTKQMRAYVQTIAKMYNQNPFHNFEHASHVAMSVDKLLKRIVAPEIHVDDDNEAQSKLAHGLHDYTHGITSDPLTIFAVVLSALIHDVDHKGVSNMQLAKEDPALAAFYRNKSIAEQNSIDLGWEILMNDDMKDLRMCIYTDEDELKRFRETLINVVLATDIFDKELNDLRKQRWKTAFAEKSPPTTEQRDEDINVKATIVIEHLIQASDVSHTMQHWHIYCKWNKRLFKEMRRAYKQGRMGADPATFWYKGEIGFFDNYIIPLAKKLKECNVFGVSSDEYLSYAVANREEWEQKGQQIVAELVEEVTQEEEKEAKDKEVPSDKLKGTSVTFA